MYSALYENYLSGKKCKMISCIIICIIHMPLFKSNLTDLKHCQILESAYDFQDFNRVLQWFQAYTIVESLVRDLEKDGLDQVTGKVQVILT